MGRAAYSCWKRKFTFCLFISISPVMKPTVFGQEYFTILETCPEQAPSPDSIQLEQRMQGPGLCEGTAWPDPDVVDRSSRRPPP